MRQLRTTFLGFALCLSLQLTLSGQAKLGIKAGVAFPQSETESIVLQHPLDAYHHNLTLKETPYGWRAGLFLRVPFNKTFYLQPEVIFSLQQTNYGLNNIKLGKVSDHEERTQFIDIPIGIGAKFGALRLHGGASGHYMLSHKSDFGEILPNYSPSNDDISLNWMAGIGLDLWNVTIDARYDSPVSGRGSSFLVGDQTFQFQKTIPRILVSMGVVF